MNWYPMSNLTSQIRILFLATIVATSGCAGCGLIFGESDDNARTDPSSTPNAHQGTEQDAGGLWDDRDAGGESDPGDASSDSGNSSDSFADADTATADATNTTQDTSPPEVCGDGTVGAGEACDDGNTDDDDYCAADCSAETGRCGDGVQQSNEACDDGNTDDGDYCSADCKTVTGSCGDAILQNGESCDDGATTDCTGTHDGGDGTCVPVGTCSAGYVLDGGSCQPNATGLTVPCQNGPGFTLFRFHYSNNSTSAQVDVWDATCSYSFAPNSACNVREVCAGFCDVPVTSQGYPVFSSSNYLRVRFNVNGLNFTQATLWIQARSYATSSSTNYEVWSPLYGGVIAGPVDNDFVYDWYGLDWTGFLFPGDDPNLTAIQVYGAQGSLAVKAVEMCVQ